MTQDKTVLCACLCALIGVSVYALLAFGIIMPQPYPYFGTDIYNAYFYRLLEGRFDLPLRMLTLEGHYSADGTGILYHGISPLLTRAALHPFVVLNQFPTAQFSIWLWAAIGTGLYHLALFQVIRKYIGGISLAWVVMTGLAIWICSPGFLLSTNPVLYHEPISISYAAMAVAFYLMLRCALFGMPWRYVIIPAAFMAGILLHARPHLAVGLYVGISAMIAMALWQDTKRMLVPAIVSLVILGFAGTLFLQLNTARFGSATAAHGQIEGPDAQSQVQYGPVFFGSDYAISGRGVVFAEHGRFHPWRILPNALIYIFDAPVAIVQSATLHRKATEDISGYGFVETPRFGMLILWTAWITLMVVGLSMGRPRLSGGYRAIPLLLTTGIAAGLMLSYPTVTLRYRFDVWPLVMALCLLSLPGLIRRFGPEILQNARVLSLSVIVLLCGVFLSARVAVPLKLSYQKAPGHTYEAWDVDMCLTRLARHAFSPERLAQLCVDPQSVFEQRSKD
ncbi:hypothetical protein [Yoonia sp. MH D7]